MTRWLSWMFVLVMVSGCVRREVAVHHPVSHEPVIQVDLGPIMNHTVYDDEPLELEAQIRRVLRHRYAVRVGEDGGDLRLNLVFIDFRRANIRLSGNNRSRNLSVQAELVMSDPEGGEIRRTRLNDTETYEDDDPGNFENARNRLLRRLSDRLVIDLFES